MEKLSLSVSIRVVRVNAVLWVRDFILVHGTVHRHKNAQFSGIPSEITCQYALVPN